MDTIKYTEIEKESTRVEIHGDNVEVIDVARAEVRKVEIVAAAQAKAIAMKEPAAAEEFAAEEEPAVAEEPADEEELLTEEPAAEEEPEEGSAEEEPAERRIPAENSDETVHVIGVRFRTAGKVYFFDPGQWEVRHGCHVIVETARGVEYGTVVGLPMDVKASKVTQPLKEVIRVATPEDTETEILNRVKEREAYRICQEKIQAHGLDMKLINAEYTFDNSKVLFYFTADGRVDFRDLVKDLASVFRTRIELRQIGVRDETKILGGYGICGRPLCCHTWMSDFIPVSIKMAKEQNLSLNPGKISGVCGRLMCCLKNEADTYEELNRNLPKVGDEVQGNDGLSGQVESVNVLRQTVRILVEVDDEKEFHEYHVSDLTVLRRRRRGGNRSRKDNAADSKEAQELEKLESQERQESRGENKNRGNKNKSNRNKNRRRQENNSNAQ
jgi:cell fate regulator YaaT (PSP1 superfamily)